MRLTSLVLLATAAVPAVAQAQQQSPTAATGGTTTGTKVAIRALGPVVATSAESLGVVAGVRALPGGGVLVNDMMRRRVLMLDAALASPTTIVDSASGAANSYGPRPGGLIPYRGDSTLFVDPASLSMLVLDGKGQVARVMSVPRSDDANALASGAFGTPGFDAQGRLVYRAMPTFTFRGGPGGVRMRAEGAAAGGASGGSTRVQGHAGAPPAGMPTMPDTVPLVRIDLASRKLDTLAWVKTTRPNMQMTQGEDGRMEVKVVMNPLPTVDDWAVTSDGSVAVVRGRDYRIDWIGADGSQAAATKLPFEWKRMTDEDKEAFIDSLKAQRARMGPNAPMPLVPGQGAAPVVAPMMVTTRVTEAGPGGPVGGRSETRTASASSFEFVPPSELPDYRPAFLPNAVRADNDGNLWIRTTAVPTAQGMTVYDVVDRKGTIVDRVQIASNKQLLGFGTDGTVLLASRENNVAKLEKVKLR